VNIGSSKPLALVLSVAAIAIAGCQQSASNKKPGAQGLGPSGGPSTGSPSGSSPGTLGGAATGSTGTPGTIGQGGSSPSGNTGGGSPGGGSGAPADTTGGMGGGTAGTTAGTADGGTSMGGGGGAPLAPSTRNPKYKSVAPALGQPLPMATPGTWTYTDIDGALSRDGSPAGFYYRLSKTGNKNLLIYLVGGGLCADNFFCNMNPPNKAASLTAESVGSGVFNIFGPDAEAQDPTLSRWDSGVFKDDPANPVKDWNAVYIPYVTGDLFAGTKPNGTVPDVTGTFQFVGHDNMMKFLARIVPTFKDAPVVLLTGSSAGGIGALMTAPFLMDAYIDLNTGTRGFAVDDAGPIFDDMYLDPCFQQRFRDVFSLNTSFPEDCADCKGTGGGMVKAYLAYLIDKYPDNLLGGLIDSDDDEIMKFFFSEALEGCNYIDNPIIGLTAYPDGQYSAGLKNLLDVHFKRMSSYIWTGTLHQNLFETASGDRFYDKNGLMESPAEWLTKLLSGQMERVGM
jgi:hypothetical protein